jgi:chromate transporter
VAVAPMSGENNTLGSVAAHFLLLSLLAVGGGNAAIPEMHRQAVEVLGWMTDHQFADLFAIAQVAPGPNIIIVTLIGFHVAGIAGAIVATLAMCGPTSLLAYGMGHVWRRFEYAQWRVAIQSGLVPVSVGLIAASALILAQAADVSAVAFALTLAMAATAYFTRIHPLWVFGVAALVGYLGLV